MAVNSAALMHVHQGRSLADAGNLTGAINAYRQALFLDPELAEAYRGLAEAHQSLGELDDAAIYYEQALVFAPGDGEVHFNLGVISAQQGNPNEAITHYKNAIALRPGLAAAYNNLGTLFKAQDRFDDARAHYEQALRLEPLSVQAHNNMGALYHAQGKFDAAIDWYRRALKLAPDYAEALHNLGDALIDSGDIDAAMTHYDRALEADPNLHYAVYSKATVQLLLGDYRNGWQGYEARWTAGIAGEPMRDYPWPLWDGAKPQQGKVLIWGEQGIGDEIMFASVLPDVMRRTGGACVVDCANARLLPLLRRSFPDIKIISGGAAGDDITAHLPISSLPRLFRNSAEDFANIKSPYLMPDSTMVDEFRARYSADKKRIGLAWHTYSQKAAERFRSVPLAEFAPLFAAAPDAAWINLQYGDANKLAAEIRTAGAPLLTDKTVDQLHDMDRFAAQIAALDLVITIDNTTAHLAGALGVPTWLLLPAMPNWRWLLGRADSPWYPSLRLFRQPMAGDWHSVVQDLIKILNV